MSFFGGLTFSFSFQDLYFGLLAKSVKGDSKAHFSIATTPRCRGGHYSFLWIAPLYLFQFAKCNVFLRVLLD